MTIRTQCHPGYDTCGWYQSPVSVLSLQWKRSDSFQGFHIVVSYHCPNHRSQKLQPVQTLKKSILNSEALEFSQLLDLVEMPNSAHLVVPLQFFVLRFLAVGAVTQKAKNNPCPVVGWMFICQVSKGFSWRFLM